MYWRNKCLWLWCIVCQFLRLYQICFKGENILRKKVFLKFNYLVNFKRTMHAIFRQEKDFLKPKIFTRENTNTQLKHFIFILVKYWLNIMLRIHWTGLQRSLRYTCRREMCYTVRNRVSEGFFYGGGCSRWLMGVCGGLSGT